MILPSPLLSGRLIRRYKRFFSDVLLKDGRIVTAHCPNTGTMLGVAEPDSEVWLSVSDNPKRKLRHTLEMIRVGRVWVGLHAAKANDVARRALETGAYAPFAGYKNVKREVPVDEGSDSTFG